MPDLRRHPYEHQPPHRPARLPRRTTPPPARPDPPDLRLLLFVGIALAAVLVALAMPYLVSYLIQALGA